MLRYLLLIAAAIPLCSQPKGLPHIPLPADLSGTHEGTEYKIRVPANWNGTLLVYAHGSMCGGVEASPPALDSTPTLEEQLLSAGYALAGSLYKDSEQEGPQRTLALTNFFKGAVGDPRRIIVWGLSLGGVTTLMSIETHSGLYDGAIAVSPMPAGRPNMADLYLRYDLAYAAVFGWPSNSWGPIEDLRDDLYTDGNLFDPFQWFNGENYGQWEFIRLVMQESSDAWWNVDPALGAPGWVMAGWAATAYRSHWQQLCGGPVSQNVGVKYSLTNDEKAYLTSLGVDADGLLAWMNSHTNITASRSARQHLAQYGTPSGHLRRPVVTMHGTFDPLQPVSSEALYRGLVDAAGDADELVQVYVDTYHAAFSAAQYLATLNAMEHWLNTGVRPGNSFFPASEGFNNSFVPPPWPY